MKPLSELFKNTLKPGLYLQTEINRLRELIFKVSKVRNLILDFTVNDPMLTIITIHLHYAVAEMDLFDLDYKWQSNPIQLIYKETSLLSEFRQNSVLSNETLKLITEKFDEIKNETALDINYREAPNERHLALLSLVTWKLIPYIHTFIHNLPINFDQCDSIQPEKRQSCGWKNISKSDCEVVFESYLKPKKYLRGAVAVSRLLLRTEYIFHTDPSQMSTLKLPGIVSMLWLHHHMKSSVGLFLKKDVIAVGTVLIRLLAK